MAGKTTKRYEVLKGFNFTPEGADEEVRLEPGDIATEAELPDEISSLVKAEVIQLVKAKTKKAGS